MVKPPPATRGGEPTSGADNEPEIVVRPANSRTATMPQDNRCDEQISMWRRRFRLDRYPVFREIYHCGLTAEQLRRISDQFGCLSEIGRKRLHLGIISVLQFNWFRGWGWGKGAPASKLADHFRAIENRASELLSLLGEHPGPTKEYPLEANFDLARRLGDEIARVLIEEGTNNLFWRRVLRTIPAEGKVVGGVPTVAGELPIGVTGGGSLNLVQMTLAVLAKATSRARAEARASVSPGRGGARRKGPTPSSAFARDLIALYCEMRKRYPGSGPAPGYSPGGPLARFVLAVFTAVREHNPDLKLITDTSIGSLFYEVQKSRRG